MQLALLPRVTPSIGTIDGAPVMLRRLPGEGGSLGLVRADGTIIQSVDRRFATDAQAEATLRTWLDR